MTDDRLPIVYAKSTRLNVAGLVIGAVALAIGVLLTFNPSTSRYGSSYLSSGRTPSEIGWILVGMSLVFVLAVLLQLARGCPRLELTSEGIWYSRCLRGNVHIKWSEVDRAEIQEVRVTRPFGGVDALDYLVLVANDGRKLAALVPVAYADVLAARETIMRVAARMRSVPEVG